MNIDFYIPRAERRFDNWGYFEYAKEKYYTYFKFFKILSQVIILTEMFCYVKLSFLQSK